MKKQIISIIVILLFQCISLPIQGQVKQLPLKVRADFCKNANFNYKYGNDSFKTFMTMSARNIGLNSIIEIEIAIEKICDNFKLQDEFFKYVLQINGGRDFIFM
jgi:hypothetical protein